MSKLLGVVDKNARERIEVRTAEYQGHPYIDIRTYWRSGNGDDWKPSKKGVTLKPTLVGELIAALQKADGIVPTHPNPSKRKKGPSAEQ